MSLELKEHLRIKKILEERGLNYDLVTASLRLMNGEETAEVLAEKYSTTAVELQSICMEFLPSEEPNLLPDFFQEYLRGLKPQQKNEIWDLADSNPRFHYYIIQCVGNPSGEEWTEGIDPLDPDNYTWKDRAINDLCDNIAQLYMAGRNSITVDRKKIDFKKLFTGKSATFYAKDLKRLLIEMNIHHSFIVKETNG